jgi:threonylcarbamoyladenosine tRNA methylthiotransferase MtaB
MGEVIRNIKTLLDGGYKEIVLTGVDITDYGQDLPSKPTLGALLKRVFKMIKQDDFRLRLSSVDVAEICDDLRHIFEQEPRFMPYFHLSLQSGDDMILKRMKRRHRRHELLEFCHWAKKIRPETGIGADIIAGFPTETEEMFQNSLNIIAEAGLNFPHIFPYSEREGTPAAKIPPAKQVPKKIRKERAKLMREAGQIELQKLYKKMDGTRQND